MITSPNTMTRAKVVHERCPMAASEPGKPAAMAVKMSNDIPLPMPCSVICSPSHMIRPVPAVIVSTIITMMYHDSLGITVGQVPPKRFSGARAKVTRVEDCSTARPMVR